MKKKPTFEELVEKLDRRPFHRIGKGTMAKYRSRIKDLERRGLIKYSDDEPPRLILTEKGRLYNVDNFR